MSDPYAQDDIVVSELHIPKGKKIILRWDLKMYCTQLICHILEQMNCVPGMVTEFAFEPIYTIRIESCLIWLKSS
jgi:cytochrome c oxidase subunit 2